MADRPQVTEPFVRRVEKFTWSASVGPPSLDVSREGAQLSHELGVFLASFRDSGFDLDVIDNLMQMTFVHPDGPTAHPERTILRTWHAVLAGAREALVSNEARRLLVFLGANPQGRFPWPADRPVWCSAVLEHATSEGWVVSTPACVQITAKGEALLVAEAFTAPPSHTRQG